MVNLPYICSSIPKYRAYGLYIYILQLIRYVRACSSYGDLIDQGDTCTLEKLKYFRYNDIKTVLGRYSCMHWPRSRIWKRGKNRIPQLVYRYDWLYFWLHGGCVATAGELSVLFASTYLHTWVFQSIRVVLNECDSNPNFVLSSIWTGDFRLLTDDRGLFPSLYLNVLSRDHRFNSKRSRLNNPFSVNNSDWIPCTMIKNYRKWRSRPIWTTSDNCKRIQLYIELFWMHIYIK